MQSEHVRQSGCGDIVENKHHLSVFDPEHHTEKKKSPRKRSKDTTNSSPVDPAYDSATKTFRTSPIAEPKTKSASATLSTALDNLSVELPPIAITGPDEQPRSFFDDDSSSDDDSPIVQRASSVRVAKPQIIKHAYSLKGHVPKICTEGLVVPDAGPNLSKASTLLREPLKNLYDLSPISSHRNSCIGQGPAEALRALEGASSSNCNVESVSLRAGGPQDALKALEANGRSVQHGYVPDTPTKYVPGARPDLAISLPSVKTGSEQVRGSYMSGSTALNPSNGLRSNPFSSTDRVHLSRAISAPLPHRNPNRKVKIRPTDLITPHSDQEHIAFHEAIVSTPYPKHGFSISSIEEELKEKERLAQNPRVFDDRSFQSKDRFPSPTRVEMLYLVLALAQHRGAAATIEIEIPHRDIRYRAMSDSSSASQYKHQPFDDEDLFLTIRQGYYKSSFKRALSLFSARRLSHIVTQNPQALFDEVDFMRHLHDPSLGKDRKTWTLWLRNTQELRISQTPPKGGSAISHPEMGTIDEDSALPNSISSASSPQSKYSRYSFARSPTYSARLARPLFMPWNGKPMGSPPVLELHYTFSLPKIFFFTTAILLLSTLSTVLWVLFGFPGIKAGQLQHNIAVDPKYKVTGASGGIHHWRPDAEARVLVGLVLGVLTLMFGGLLQGCWIWASWILL